MTTAPVRRRLTDLPYATQAALLCQDEGFQLYAAWRCALPGVKLNASAAAEWLRQQCRIDSRAALDTDPAARGRLDQLRTDFDAWRGKIAAPR